MFIDHDDVIAPYLLNTLVTKITSDVDIVGGQN